MAGRDGSGPGRGHRGVSTRDLRAFGRRLRWQLYNLAAPADLRLPAPPWPHAAAALPGRVMASYDAPAAPVFAPLLYGREPAPGLLAELPQTTGSLPLALRQLDDVVLAGAEFIIDRRRGEVLPQSFASALAPRSGLQGNGLTQRPPPIGAAPPRSEAPVFVADLHYDEFGHRLLELAPRLLLARDAPADIDVATSLRLGKDLLAMSRAFEIAPGRWRRFTRPMFCRTALVPDPPLRLWRPVHPLAREAFARLARLGQGVRYEGAERVYFSRAGVARRKLLNEAEIEAMFAAHGFLIVRPETHPFETQIAIAAGAKLIAGPAGSAMHLAALAPAETRVLILSSPRSFELTEAFLNPVEERLGLVFGQVPPEAGDAYWAPWRIDARDVLAGLAGHFGLGRIS